MTTPNNWKTYYDATRQQPPRPLLVKALSFVPPGGSALDLGAGALQDSRYLLSQGFSVTALDSSPLLAEEAQSINNQNFQFVVSTYDAYIFPSQVYSLVVAIFSLPFNPPQTFAQVFTSVTNSLKPQGIFVGQLFGINDEWCGKKIGMTFHTRQQVEKLFSDYDTLQLEEEEKDGEASGKKKHWHIFHIIARKK